MFQETGTKEKQEEKIMKEKGKKWVSYRVCAECGTTYLWEERKKGGCPTCSSAKVKRVGLCPEEEYQSIKERLEDSEFDETENIDADYASTNESIEGNDMLKNETEVSFRDSVDIGADIGEFVLGFPGAVIGATIGAAVGFTKTIVEDAINRYI